MGERLTELFAAEHRIDAATLRGLGESELDELRMTVLGQADQPFRARAMNALVVARGSEAAEPLAEVLRAENEDSSLRATAAAQLGRVGAAAEPALIEALRAAPEPVVAGAAAAALAKAGTPTALEPLTELARATEGSVARQARFAATVVAFRHRITGHEPALPSAEELMPAPEGEAAPIRIGETPGEIGRALEELGPDSYGAALAPDSAVPLECGPDRLLVALDHAHTRNLTEAGTAPMLAGLIAWQEPVRRTYSVRWLVLAWPGEGGGTHVAVYRPSGQQFLSGDARLDAERGEFELRTVQGQGNVPIVIRGAVEGGAPVSFEGVSGRPQGRAPTQAG